MPEGRVLNLNNTFVYEYQYKDHLGNLRVSFREANQVQYSAGLEETNNAQFDFDTSPIRNSERARAGSFSAKTNITQPMALWKSLPVSKGDKVNMSVWANYTQPSTSINNIFNFAPFFLSLGQNTGAYSESGGNPVRLQAGFNVLGFFVPNVNINASVPKSYLIYRFFIRCWC